MSDQLPTVVEAVEFRRNAYGLTCAEWAKVIDMTEVHYREFLFEMRDLNPRQMAKCFEFGIPATLLFQCAPDKGMAEIKGILKRPKGRRCIGGPKDGYFIDVAPGTTELRMNFDPGPFVTPYRAATGGGLESLNVGRYILTYIEGSNPVWKWEN
jgi:hypothetical protein